MITVQRINGALRHSIRRAAMFIAFMLLLTSTAAAGTITIAWNPNPEPTVAGYIVFVGTSAGNYTASYDVGMTTTFTLANAVAGTTYHMAVRAYSSGTNMSPMSADLVASLSSPLTAPTPLAPSGSIASTTPTYSWSAVATATSYTLAVDDAQQTGKIRQAYSASQVGCAAGTGACTVTPSVALAAGTAKFAVMASTTSSDGPWSAAGTFTVPTPTVVTPPSSTPPPASSTTSLSVVPHAGWKVTYVDSQETSAGNNSASNAFDDDPATFWATEWSKVSPAPPHEIQIDLGKSYALGGFRYLPRQDEFTYGNIANYEFYVSADGSNWGTPVASGNFASGAAVQQVQFALTNARFIRLRALTEVSGYAWSAVAELNVLAQTAAADPLIPRTGWKTQYVDSQESVNPATNVFDGRADTFWATQWSSASPAPPHEIQINLGATYNVSGFRYLPRQDGFNYGNIGQYEFYVSADGTNWGAAVATGTFSGGAEQEVTFKGKSGQYIKLRALTEVLGRPWTAVAELNVMGVLKTAGPVPVPRTAWTVKSVDSQETKGAANEATNVFDGRIDTIWATKWLKTSPPPPHEIQIDLGASYNVTGFRYLPRQDGISNGNIAGYEFYVSSDGVKWGTKVASGTFPAGSSEQQVTFTPKSGRYIRLRALSEVNGNAWTAVSELQVLQPAP